MEQYVECKSRGLTLRGMMHIPDGHGGNVPFVILFHGFCDDRNEINFVHTELSRRLCERGSPACGSILPAAARATACLRT